MKKLGFLLQWTDVRGLADPKRPRLVLMLPVGLSKPRLVIDMRLFHRTCCHVMLGMDTVVTVEIDAEKGLHEELDNRSGFHKLDL